MQTPFLTEIALEKMQRTIDAAQAPSLPVTVRRAGISRRIRSLAISRFVWRPSRRPLSARTPMADPVYRA